MKKLITLFLLAVSAQAFASPVTMDVLNAPDGLSINMQQGVYSLPNVKVTEQIVTQSAAQTISNKSFDKSDNTRLQARAVWDFAVNGGASGQHLLTTPLPAKAVITKTYFEMITAPTQTGAGSGGLVFNVSASTLGDILLNKAASTMPVSPVQTVDHTLFSNSAKLSAATLLSLDLTGTGGAALTAGKFVLVVDYYVSE